MSLMKAVSKLEGLLPGAANTDSAAGSDAQFLAREEARWKAEAAVAGTTAIAERGVFRAKRKCRIVGIWLTSATATTANGTNYLSVLVDKRAATDYTTAINLVTFNMDTPTTDDLVAFTPKDIGPASAHADADKTKFTLNRGDVVTVEVTKTGGSGLAYPISDLTIQTEPVD